jgi:hypothetical protein
MNREPRENSLTTDGKEFLTRIPQINANCIIAERRQKIASYEMVGTHSKDSIRPERSMAFGVSRQPLIFFMEEIKRNRGKNKSAGDVNNMMLVGQQR